MAGNDKNLNARLDNCERWIKELSQVKFELGDFVGNLQSGVILCIALNSLKAGIVPAEYAKISQRKLSAFHNRDRIASFLKGCKKFGVNQADIFSVEDLFSQKGLKQVVITLENLSATASKQGITQPFEIGIQYATKNKRRFSDAQLQKAKHAIPKMSKGSVEVNQGKLKATNNKENDEKIELVEENESVKQKYDDLNAKFEALQQSLNDKEKDIQILEKEKITLQETIHELKQEIDINNKPMNEFTQQLETYKTALNNKNNEMNVLNQKLMDSENKYKIKETEFLQTVENFKKKIEVLEQENHAMQNDKNKPIVETFHASNQVDDEQQTASSQCGCFASFFNKRKNAKNDYQMME